MRATACIIQGPWKALPNASPLQKLQRERRLLEFNLIDRHETIQKLEKQIKSLKDRMKSDKKERDALDKPMRIT